MSRWSFGTAKEMKGRRYGRDDSIPQPAPSSGYYREQRGSLDVGHMDAIRERDAFRKDIQLRKAEERRIKRAEKKRLIQSNRKRIEKQQKAYRIGA